MRSPNISILYDTLSLCFLEALQSAGPAVKQMVYRILSQAGIVEADISSKFSDVQKILEEKFGSGGNLMIVSTLKKLCEEYSIRPDLSYAPSLQDRLEQLKERILVEKLVPKRLRKSVETNSFEDKSGNRAPWSD